MNKKQVKILLDYIDSQNKCMCTDDRKALRKCTEQRLTRENEDNRGVI